MTTFLKLLIPAVSLIFVSLPSLAQQVLGSTTIKNRTIEILDNKTWRYKFDQSKNSSDCDALKLGVYFCNIDNWKVTLAQGPASHTYMIDDRTYVMFIIENMGSDDGVTREAMAKMALGYAAEAGNIPLDNVPQHFSRNRVVNSNKFLSIAYSAKTSNINFTFINNIFIGDRVSVQAVTYVVGSKVTEKQITHNETLIGNLSMESL